MKMVFITVLLFVSIAAHASRRHYASASPASPIEEVIDAAFVKAPQDQEVCFSPEEHCDLKLLKFVQSAQKSIDVAIYDINLDQLVHALLIQSKKIPVRIIVDKKQAKGSHSLVVLLLKAGANVRHGHQRGIFHNKFTIVDGKMVETGSFNYTNHASQANNENQIYLANPQIVDRFLKRFDTVWERADSISGH
jgi:phosphatidylserine/phosphatidylglycerophosphate/cardiolipin synthase-like enzyme